MFITEIIIFSTKSEKGNIGYYCGGNNFGGYWSDGFFKQKE